MAGRAAPGASTTSWPWAHVSISRAVMNERAPMDGPLPGEAHLGVEQRRGKRSSARCSRHHCEQLGGRQGPSSHLPVLSKRRHVAAERAARSAAKRLAGDGPGLAASSK